MIQGDEVDAEEDCDNETDNGDFIWEELDSAKRAAAKKACANPGKIWKIYFFSTVMKIRECFNRRHGTQQSGFHQLACDTFGRYSLVY